MVAQRWTDRGDKTDSLTRGEADKYLDRVYVDVERENRRTCVGRSLVDLQT